MTQYPEVALARELGVCYVNLSLVTDYDTGVEDQPDHEAVSQDDVIAALRRHTDTLRGAISDLVLSVGPDRLCACAALRAIPLGH